MMLPILYWTGTCTHTSPCRHSISKHLVNLTPKFALCFSLSLSWWPDPGGGAVRVMCNSQRHVKNSIRSNNLHWRYFTKYLNTFDFLLFGICTIQLKFLKWRIVADCLYFLETRLEWSKRQAFLKMATFHHKFMRKWICFY